MTKLNRRKERLRLALAVAVTLGCTSATASGTLAAFTWNAPTLASPPPAALA